MTDPISHALALAHAARRGRDDGGPVDDFSTPLTDDDRNIADASRLPPFAYDDFGRPISAPVSSEAWKATQPVGKGQSFFDALDVAGTGEANRPANSPGMLQRGTLAAGEAPTQRDILRDALMGDKPTYERANFVSGLNDLFGLTPAGAASDALDAAKRNDVVQTALNAVGALPVGGGAAHAIFAGPMARTADKVALETAKRMAAEGADRAAIWNKTGWFTGPDSKWRFEIPDTNLNVNKSVAQGWGVNAPVDLGAAAKEAEALSKEGFSEDKIYRLTQMRKNSSGEWEGSGSIAPLSPITHPELGAAYDLSSLRINQEPKLIGTGFGGNFDADFNKAISGSAGKIDLSPSLKDPRSAAAHELQHVVQKVEGFPFGGNLDEGQDIYNRLAGEVEARNVQSRMNMTPEERRAIPPWETQDVPDAEQIVRYGANGPQASLSPDEVSLALAKAREILPKADPRIMWHGSPSGDLRGGTSGLHLGTFDAAKQALDARIGIPAQGNWEGTSKYGDTMLAGRNRLLEIDPRGYNRSGYNIDAPVENYIPMRELKYANGDVMPMDVTPAVLPYRIIGPMKNSFYSPMDDARANGVMQGLLKRGQARNGLYYRNIGEDAGSVSAALPGPDHVEPIDLERLLRFGEYAKGGAVETAKAILASA